ncbi:MAG: polyhydroxyalkanoate synthesis regulator DNA-binding domain-containing protein [Gammaproteobacteria bacterium]
MSELRKLKKYPNRRLYDFERHCYVCLDDVRELIAAKHDVQVIENETSSDITRETMMQVVMLLEERGRPLFSNAFLAQLIQCRAADTSGRLGRYLDECMKVFVENLDRARAPAGDPAEDSTRIDPSDDSIALDIPVPLPGA